jgi:hypothetical protein
MGEVLCGRFDFQVFCGWFGATSAPAACESSWSLNARVANIGAGKGIMDQTLALLTAPANLPFAVALALMLMIGLVEAIGLGGSAVELEADVDGDAGLLAWLGLGRLPLLIVLVVFLALFGIIGLVVQQVASGLAGAPLPPLLASGGAALAALPLTGVAGRGLARVLPRDETTAVPLDSLVGRTGAIVTGEARSGCPARARVADRHGQAHYVMVEPDNAGQIFREGETVLLVRRDAETFRAIAYDNPLLPRLD